MRNRQVVRPAVFAEVGRRAGRFLIALLLSIGACLLLDTLFPPDLSRARTFSTRVEDARGRLLHGFLTPEDTWRLPVALAEVDPLYLRMLKAREDRRFDQHPGIDPLALARALWQWAAAGRVVSGASTLTMQTVRLLEPRPRTLASKAVELLRALQLEWRLDKHEILTLYLDLAPFGGNLEGLRAGALAWLGKEPNHLTPAEAALLVVLPQAPSQRRPDRFPQQARVARDQVLTRMGELGILAPGQAAEAREEALPRMRQALPFHAPHLARRLRAAAPDQQQHRTFIDGDLQRTLERLARQRPEDATSTAMLVVDHRAHTVLAYVGSADFFAPLRAGQVDLVQAVRSPGSTLKPLVYGMGFDDLIVHPDTVIDDVPTRFGDYLPANFQGTYHGQVSIREALQRSLNVPAVAVLERVGPQRVANRLREAGISLHWRHPHTPPGLPLVLGGVGITLADLVKLYAGIAAGGRVVPLRYSTADPPGEEQPLLSPEAAATLTAILEAAPPPAEVVTAGNRRDPRAIAFKTGTSYGFRDAWALGYDRAYTVGIWVGRPDGSPNPGHYGHNTAAPLLFQVFALLPVVLAPGQPPAERGPPPARLQVFRVHPEAGPADRPFGIGFPVHGSTVELPRHAGRFDPLPLVATGGGKPVRWLVNGLPVAASTRHRHTFWQPDGAGLIHITAFAADGRMASAEVWLAGDGTGMERFDPATLPEPSAHND